jgi:hypothetical protein
MLGRQTGNFDVIIVKDGRETLVHSKKERGQGRCESKAEVGHTRVETREEVVFLDVPWGGEWRGRGAGRVSCRGKRGSSGRPIVYEEWGT